MAEKKEYTPSETVKAAEAALAAQKDTRPEYRSGWDSQLKNVMDRILNREEFRYNLNGDALYRQYRDQAVRNGKRAMEDTMGQAAALTGGYGNSYAQSVGQQAYQRQMDALGDRIPELYALALDQYRQQSQNLQQKYDLLFGAENRDYGRYQDSLAAWQKEADQLWKIYTDSRDYDYGVYRDGVADEQWQQRFDADNDQWQKEFDESARRYNQEWDAAHPAVQTPQVVYRAAPQKQEAKEEKETKDEKKKFKMPKGLVSELVGSRVTL